MPRVDLNCDMGESFGRWSLGDDLGMMPYLTSVNIATGYHAGDPPTIRRTVAAAVRQGLAIGAHLAFPDLMGFGRRRMVIPAEDLEDYCLYQLGALQAFVRAAGGRLAHVKPHGALYVMASEDAAVAAAIARAVAKVDASLPLMLLTPATADAVAAEGVRLVVEAFPDLHYDRTGKLVIEPVKKAWDPELVARRAVRMVLERKVAADDGTELDVDAVSLCLHGDAPNGPEIAEAVHRALTGNGIELAPLAVLLGSSAEGGRR
ncbi:5-oxoprolinase subunit PxpA [Nonomuraea sp. NPDC052116]|uniref:LamB/YcsF family protein n=1 Tax=Nonomuraea sp. NPDC052116 TaxID=3155665 RepID=UPI00342642FF